MRLVTNASPLIFLAKIDLLSLLRSCFSQVIVPPAVVAETGLNLPDFIQCRELSEQSGHAGDGGGLDHSGQDPFSG